MFVPVTIKMINDSSARPDDVFEIDGSAMNEVILIGRVVSRNEQPTRTTFDINDNTGVFSVVFYHREENSIPTALKNFEFEKNCYVKVYGSIRMFKEQRAIVGTHIARVTDFDEVTNHFLQVFTSHCVRKKGVLKEKDLVRTDGSSKMPTSKEDFKKLLLNELSKLAKSSSSAQVKRADLYKAVDNKLSHGDFEAALKDLTNDMSIYSTDNNDTFQIVGT